VCTGHPPSAPTAPPHAPVLGRHGRSIPSRRRHHWGRRPCPVRAAD